MTQPTHISLNDLKRTRRSTSKTSPGGRASMQQDTFDRQQITVCDIRSKVQVHISTNVIFNGVKRTTCSTSTTPPGGRSLMHKDTFDRQQVTVCNTRSKVCIATWNVHTMHHPGKMENIKREANHMNLDILGLAEVRWQKSGKLLSDEHMLIYYGDIKEHKHGVGMLLKKQRSKSYMAHYTISSRILLVKLHCKPFNITLIQVYTPTNTSTVEDIDELYHDLEVAYKHCKSQDMRIIMGHLNAKVGKEQDPLNVTVGPHDLGERNERGDLWTEWCSPHDQVILNTWFQHYLRHLYTWKSPGDGTRNQIDYITPLSRGPHSNSGYCPS